MSYALEKLGTIYYKLAIGEGNIKQRLIEVQVEILCVTKSDLPENLHNEWDFIFQSLTAKGPLKFEGKNIIGAIPRTLKGMHKKKAAELAKRIVNLYYMMKPS